MVSDGFVIRRVAACNSFWRLDLHPPVAALIVFFGLHTHGWEYLLEDVVVVAVELVELEISPNSERALRRFLHVDLDGTSLWHSSLDAATAITCLATFVAAPSTIDQTSQ